MTTAKAEIEHFHNDFIRYKELVISKQSGNLTSEQENELQTFGTQLQRKYGSLKEVIEKYGGPSVLLLQGGNYKCEAFSSAFNYTPFSGRALTAVMDTAIATLNMAIGSLGTSLELKQLPVATEKLTGGADAPPQAFIAHGGETLALEKLKRFLEALGVKSLVAEELPSEVRSVEQNVEFYQRKADCVIVLATADKPAVRLGFPFSEPPIVGLFPSERTHPKLNVVDELGRARAQHPDKTILLLEEGATLPSNVAGIVYERFTQENMEKAFIKVANELRAFGILKAVALKGRG